MSEIKSFSDYTSKYNSNVDFSALFSGTSDSSSVGNTNMLSDYAAIKNGSYGKLMKAYYAKQDAEKLSGTNEFRKLVEEIGILMGYEALRDLPVEDVEIETPIETCMTPMISGKKLAVIPVLRAGLGMVNSILTLVPSAKVGHVGLYRDPVTHEPHEYYCKLPEAIDERISVIVDPMLATGGSAEAAVDFVKKQGGKNIKFMCIIAAPEGLKRLHEAHPDVQIYCGHLDRELNDHAYICPGLGDAGDRIFGTM